MAWELALPFAAAGSGAAWAQLAARRAGFRRSFAVRALLGGAAAFGLAFTAYDLCELAGLPIRWERVLRGDATSVALAGVIGLLEEGAKLAGILLVVDRGYRWRAVLAAAIGVAAGFAALESLVVLGGQPSAAALARAALAPVAHALLATPLAFGITAALGRKPLRWAALPAALLVSAALHGAGDLSLALPDVGRVGYALALAAPALALLASARAQRRLRMKRVRSTRGPYCAPGATAPRSTGGRPVLRLTDLCSHRPPSSTPDAADPHPGPPSGAPASVGSVTTGIR
jgi:hypothetical protein